jgi:hypothetical protein
MIEAQAKILKGRDFWQDRFEQCLMICDLPKESHQAEDKSESR